MNTTAEKELRGMAGALIAAHDKAAEIRKTITRFDQDAAAKLAALDTEINDLNRRADGCDESAVQMLVVKKEMRVRSAAKFAAERETLLARVRREASAAVSGLNVSDFFQTALEHEIASVTAAFLPHFENETRARGAAGQADSVNALGRWSRQLVHEIPGEVIAQRLSAYADGSKPLWKI